MIPPGRLSASCRLGRGLSPFPFCYLNARDIIDLRPATRELAHRLAQNAPAALAATKALIHRAHATPIEAQLDAEKDAIIDCMHTDEFRAAVKKFSSKAK
jgi:enoyl-CoA hydratase/carnithine racemase